MCTPRCIFFWAITKFITTSIAVQLERIFCKATSFAVSCDYHGYCSISRILGNLAVRHSNLFRTRKSKTSPKNHEGKNESQQRAPPEATNNSYSFERELTRSSTETQLLKSANNESPWIFLAETKWFEISRSVQKQSERRDKVCIIELPIQ